MAKVLGKKELCICESKYFKSLQGIGGMSIHNRYEALESIINTHIEDCYKHLFSQPIIDEKTITWYAKPYIEIPRTLSSLTGAEFEKYQKIKLDSINHYHVALEKLKKLELKFDAEFIEKAIKYIDDNFIYCYDDKIVLGIWGMQIKNQTRDFIGIAVKQLYNTVIPIPIEKDLEIETESEPIKNIISFNAGEHGRIIGNSVLNKQNEEIISDSDVPEIEAEDGFEFDGWNKNPYQRIVSGPEEFIASYKKISPIHPPIKKIRWYKRFFNWLNHFFKEKGCSKWLLVLLLLLIFFLFLWKFRGCQNTKPINALIDKKPWINNDPRVGGGGIYNPGDPYQAAPTPPEYSNILPPQEGILPPNENPEIIRQPGKPIILGNRLNLLMENENKSIMDLAKDFKIQYPGPEYKVVYYDDIVKRLQIEVPSIEREKLKLEIPTKLPSEYNLFIFDEALFEGNYYPNDPAFKTPSKSWHLHAIKAPKAWDYTRGSNKITIAIIDNGFNLNHPELKNKVVMPYNVWSHSNVIFSLNDDHGTHVAGIALASIDNDIGISGIAPDCSFMPVQVANKNGLMTTTTIVDGILYALYQGADVINVSLGSKLEGLTNSSENYQQDLIINHFKEEERLWNEIMNIADKHKSTIVVAAGNENVLAGIDALHRPKNIITVSAVNKESQLYSKTSFSNFGTYSTISAPGIDIYSTFGNNDYTSMSGTSMAAPIVTGSIALMKSLNPELSNEQIICILKSTGKSIDKNIGNLIQLDKVLEKVSCKNFIDCKTENINPSSGDIQFLLSWSNYNDLDLICTDPNNNLIWFQNKRVPSGGIFEYDMNVKNFDSKTPTENIYWPKGLAPKGDYNVYVVFYQKHEPNITETQFSMKAKFGDSTKTIVGNIRQEIEVQHIGTFTIPNENDLNNNLAENLRRIQNEIAKINTEIGMMKNNSIR